METKDKKYKIIEIRGMMATIKSPLGIKEECLIYELDQDELKKYKHLRLN